MAIDVVFAHPHHEYPSYTDYRALVDAAGFETCYVDKIDVSRPCVYVISPHNGEYDSNRSLWKDRGDEHNCILTWWSLERPDEFTLGQFRGVFQRVLNDWTFDHIWDSDRWVVEEVVKDPRVTFIVLGSNKGIGKLASGEDTKYDYDVIHLSALTGHRSNILDPLSKAGIRVAPNTWGKPRHAALRSCKFLLNIHKDSWPIMEPLRFSLGAAYGIPIITDQVNNGWPYVRGGPSHCVIQKPYDELIGEVIDVVAEGYGSHRAMGLRCHDMMTGEYEFGRQVRLEAEQLWTNRHNSRIDLKIG